MVKNGKAWFDLSRQREISEHIAARRARLLPERKALQARLLVKWRSKNGELERNALNVAQFAGDATMKNQNIGSDFDHFLADEGMLAGVTAVAVRRAIAWPIEREMLAQEKTRTTMVKIDADQQRIARPIAGRKR